MSDTPVWNFRRMHPGEMNIDPVEAEFFTTEALQSAGDALVRETIQNSLDAGLPDERVTVRFFFPSSDQLLSPAAASGYFSGLWPHLGSGNLAGVTVPDPAEAADYLVVEDFGTRGMHGNPAQDEDIELDTRSGRNDFYYFWRNIGRSRKGSTDLGRWGLGKTVFQWSSRINSFFGVTLRSDDGRALLMGQSVLRIHKLDGQRYYPYGYFGAFDGDFCLPVEDPGYIARFREDFHLKRRDEPGLSVVVPYPDPDIDPGALTASVIRHYFFPILARRLCVEVVSDGHTHSLDADTLQSTLEREHRAIGRPFRGVLSLAQWGQTLAAREHVELAEPDPAYAPGWAKLPALAEHSDDLRSRFNEAGERLAFHVPVWVKPVGGEPVLSGFHVYLERDDALNGSEEHFIRDGITVAGVRSGLQSGVRAIVSVTDRALSELLGDSENPAHTEWQERSPKFRNRYKHGVSTLRYVKNAPRELVRLLTRTEQGRDYTLLRHLFSLEMPTEEALRKERQKKQQPGDTETAAEQQVETAAGLQRFQLQKTAGGFRLRRAPAATLPRRVVVTMAYETRRGNPFKQYQPPDFELDKHPIRIETDKGRIRMRRLNRLALEIEAPDFSLAVTGFDVNRDIRVRVEPAGGESP